MASTLVHLGKDAEAERLARESFAWLRRHLGRTHPYTLDALNVLGLALARNQNPKRGELLLRRCAEHYRKLVLQPEYAWLAADVSNTLGECLMAQERFEEAEPLLVDSFAVIRDALGEYSLATRVAADRLLTLYTATDKRGELAEILRVAGSEQREQA